MILKNGYWVEADAGYLAERKAEWAPGPPLDCPHCGEPCEIDAEYWSYCEECDWHEYEDEGDGVDEMDTWEADDDDC